MQSLTELSTAELRDAGNAVETLIEFREYLPPDLPPSGMLLIRAGRFRDDIRELLGMPGLERVSPEPYRKPLAELEDADLLRLGNAAATLHARFADYTDDPDLVWHLGGVLSAATFEAIARTVTNPEASAS